MDCKFESQFEKKKSKNENEDRLYEQLFDRNITNHKAITKFAHNASKLKAVIQMAKQKMIQKKFNSGVRKEEAAGKSDIVGKVAPGKLIRPKTSKKSKVSASRVLSGMSQKFT